MSDTKQPTYYAVVPSNIRYDNSLTMSARMMYGEITALSNKKGYCWASNRYFAELYEVTEDSITRWIKQLEEKGYITIEYVFRYNTKNNHPIKKRIIKIPHQDSVENTDLCTDKKTALCTDKNVGTKNITSNTNTDVSVSVFTSVKTNPSTSVGLPTESPTGDKNKRGLFVEQEAPKQKKQTILTQSEKALLQVVEEFFVNDPELHFNHRLPTKENGFKKTVLIKKVFRYLDQLQNGTFLSNIVLCDKQKEYNLSLIKKPMLLEGVKDLLCLAVDRWKLHLMQGYKPDNKEYVVKTSLDQWFYNERSQFSWFLECLVNEPQLSMVSDYKKIRDNLPESFTKPFDKLYQHYWHDWDKTEWYQYYLGLQSIYSRHKQLVQWYDGIVERSGWKHYLSSTGMFAHSFYMWLRDYPYYTNLKLLNTNSQLWRDWRRYALGMWKTDVNPNQKFLDQCIQENEYHAEELRKWEIRKEAERKAAYQRELELG